MRNALRNKIMKPYRYPKKPVYRQTFALILFVSGLLVFSTSSYAFSYRVQDARAAAMGGVGVATDPRNAVFFNPALLVTDDENYDWYTMLPSYSRAIADADQLEEGYNNFLVAANNLYISQSQEDATAAEEALAALKDNSYRKRTNTTVVLGVPSVILSGAFHVNVSEIHSVTTDIGTPDFNDLTSPQYNSTLNHKGVNILEMGFSSALPFRTRFLGLGDIKLGAGVKMLLIEGIGYSEEVEFGSLQLSEKGKFKTTSLFNFDFGFSKEVGVWKSGLALKNIISKDIVLGDTGETYSIDPLVQAGLAYRSRLTYFEVDVDLTKTHQLGLEDKNQFASVGWEYELVSWLYLRLGAQYDLGGENLTTGTYGIGIDINGFEIDAAVMTNEEEESFYAQLTLKM